MNLPHSQLPPSGVVYTHTHKRTTQECAHAHTHTGSIYSHAHTNLSLTQSLIFSLISPLSHPLLFSLIYSFSYSLTHSPIHTLSSTLIPTFPSSSQSPSLTNSHNSALLPCPSLAPTLPFRKWKRCVAAAFHLSGASDALRRKDKVEGWTNIG